MVNHSDSSNVRWLKHLQIIWYLCYCRREAQLYVSKGVFFCLQHICHIFKAFFLFQNESMKSKSLLIFSLRTGCHSLLRSAVIERACTVLSERFSVSYGKLVPVKESDHHTVSTQAAWWKQRVSPSSVCVKRSAQVQYWVQVSCVFWWVCCVWVKCKPMRIPM